MIPTVKIISTPYLKGSLKLYAVNHLKSREPSLDVTLDCFPCLGFYNLDMATALQTFYISFSAGINHCIPAHGTYGHIILPSDCRVVQGILLCPDYHFFRQSLYGLVQFDYSFLIRCLRFHSIGIKAVPTHGDVPGQPDDQSLLLDASSDSLRKRLSNGSSSREARRARRPAALLPFSSWASAFLMNVSPIVEICSSNSFIIFCEVL